MSFTRTAFFISDGTGISSETLGMSLLSQFESVEFRHVRIPFVKTPDQARGCLREIASASTADGFRPIVFTTLVNLEVSAILRQADALVLDFFHTYIVPLEQELGLQSTHTIGRSHSRVDSSDYTRRIEAVNFALAHDDGLAGNDLGQAEVVLVGVSRSGKTPTSLYLAMQFGIKAANYPLIPEDFERRRLPEKLGQYRDKLYGLTIAPERLHQIRSERRPDSDYASVANCRYEIDEAQKLMRREGIRWLDSTTKSIEEIAATILQDKGIDRHVY